MTQTHPAGGPPTPRCPTATDFCARLERLDLLFMRYWLQRSDPPAAESMLTPELIALRLEQPLGMPHWMAAGHASRLPGDNLSLGQRLLQLTERFDLTEEESDILLLALLFELSPHYATLSAGLDEGHPQGKLTRAMVLATLGDSHAGRQRLHAALHPDAPLWQHQLLQLTAQPDAGWHQHGLVLSHSLWHFFCGSTVVDEELAAAARWLHTAPGAWCPASTRELITRTLCQPGPAEAPAVLVLRGQPHDGREQAVAAALAQQGIATLSVDLAAVEEGLKPLTIRRQLSLLLRDARLHNACLMVSGADLLIGEKKTWRLALEQQLHTAALRVVLLTEGESSPPLQLPVACGSQPAPTLQDKQALLDSALGHQLSAEQRQHFSQRYAFNAVTLPHIVREADYYRQQRDAQAMPDPQDLRRALTARTRQNFGNLAQRITPVRSFDDLIVSPALQQQLQEIVSTLRWRDRVVERHFLGKTGGKVGISALFYGESGTGKTLTAEVLAHHLGSELIKVDLSNVINKYVGETEKNLSRIFDLAEQDSGVLFFDEADALFGKRSETKDAHDRHANIEVSYLLQRLESYPGLVILATNNRNHLDSAFNRRFTFITRFTYPDAALRERMWRSIWPASLAVSAEVNFARLAENSSLTGANIRNIALLAATLAAEQHSLQITPEHIQLAIQRELAKIGRISF